MTESVTDANNAYSLMSDLPEVVEDYTDYLSVDASKERQTFYNSIEEMLTKLDEFGGLVDSIRSDTSLCVDTNVGNIQEKCGEMKHIFSRVDQLEAFVKLVRENVYNMEICVDKAESDSGAFSFKKMFSSLVGQKKTAQDKKTFDPPDIFVTEEYLHPGQSSEKTTTTSPSTTVPETTSKSDNDSSVQDSTATEQT